MPRDQRFVLGERMERQLHAILENLIRARYYPGMEDPHSNPKRKRGPLAHASGFD
jgi:hypothetical protein